MNAAGPGQFSDCSEPIHARHPPCCPRIDLNLLVRDILAFAGDPLKITVPYLASPPPTITWSKAGVDVTASDRIAFETTDYATALNNRKCNLGDTGNYTITLTNDLGSDSATVSAFFCLIRILSIQLLYACVTLIVDTSESRGQARTPRRSLAHH